MNLDRRITSRIIITGALVVALAGLGYQYRGSFDMRGALGGDGTEDIDVRVQRYTDTDGNGELSFSEVIQTVIRVLAGIRTGNGDVDVNGDNVVDRDDRRALVTSYRRIFSRVCGNGTVETGEQCDGGTGCSATCHPEPGYTCTVTNGHSTCTQIHSGTCGNGVLEANEECDDGNLRNEDCCGGTDSLAGACRIEPHCSCMVLEGRSICLPPETSSCGDGILSQDEACDDGNTTSNDGCTTCSDFDDGYICETINQLSHCRLLVLPPPPPAVCGNGILEDGEACDDANTVSSDGCRGLDEQQLFECTIEEGFTCTRDNPSVCTPVPPSLCGNGIIDSGEQCDDGNEYSGDGCSGSHESNGACQVEFCGDGSISQDASTIFEFCDDGGRCQGGDHDGEKCTHFGLDPQACGEGVACIMVDTPTCSALCTLPRP